ncbi:MAG: HD domain-containing protein [Lachnospiraceae bacterium]|nr:HD domain-containing protein [Lachnospiraceae bacterium]MDD7379520.1 HD domain-containing protein [Lachnospiraceae bacterium]MDY4616382.1 HD domain-containing protein [Lachnospiraceae bacterium]
MDLTNKLIEEMISYNRGDAKRIQHFIKVHSFAKLIGETEDLSPAKLFVLETAAVVHDIGIKPSEAKYGRCDGKLQEQEGPEPARELLKGLGYENTVIERVCYLVAHHHTYENVEGLDYRILLEADFLVNLYEDGISKEGVQRAYEKILVTETGKRICREMFGIEG